MQKCAPAHGPTDGAADASAERGNRRRGRPRAFDRDVALGQAMRLFWQKGYLGTSIADLTAAMGIGAPSLYAAFGSKEALYAEALRFYAEHHEASVWAGFARAGTARDAIEALLMDSAAALTGADGRGEPTGCMVTLAAAVEEDARLGTLVRAARARGADRIRERLERAAAAGELGASIDLAALARYVATVQGGMSLQARDGANRTELEDVARFAMSSWDARIAAARWTDSCSAPGRRG